MTRRRRITCLVFNVGGGRRSPWLLHLRNKAEKEMCGGGGGESVETEKRTEEMRVFAWSGSKWLSLICVTLVGLLDPNFVTFFFFSFCFTFT